MLFGRYFKITARRTATPLPERRIRNNAFAHANTNIFVNKDVKLEASFVLGYVCWESLCRNTYTKAPSRPDFGILGVFPSAPRRALAHGAPRNLSAIARYPCNLRWLQAGRKTDDLTCGRCRIHAGRMDIVCPTLLRRKGERACDSGSLPSCRKSSVSIRL